MNEQEKEKVEVSIYAVQRAHTIFIYSEIHHLPCILTQWLDDGGEPVTTAGLLKTALGTTVVPNSAETPHRV